MRRHPRRIGGDHKCGYHGVSRDKVFHYVASELIGREASYSGGAATVVLGILIHFAIALTVVEGGR